MIQPNNQNAMLQSLASSINYARSFQSPQAYMRALQRENPQAAEYLLNLSRTISNPYQYAMQCLSEQGISPQAFIQMLNQGNQR